MWVGVCARAHARLQSLPQCTCTGQKTISKSRFSPFTIGFQDQILVCSLILYGKCFHEPFCQPSSLDSTWFRIPHPHTYLKIPNNTSSLHLELPIFLFSPCYNNAAYCPSLMEVKILMNPFSKKLLLLDSTNIKKNGSAVKSEYCLYRGPSSRSALLASTGTYTHAYFFKRERKIKLVLRTYSKLSAQSSPSSFKLNYTDNFPAHFIHSPTWLSLNLSGMSCCGSPFPLFFLIHS